MGGHCLPSYYQKKLKAGTCKAQEMEAAIGRLRLQKQLPYNPQQEESSEVPERKVLSILSRLKQQNYGEAPGQGGMGQGWGSALLPIWLPLLGPSGSQAQGAERPVSHFGLNCVHRKTADNHYFPSRPMKMASCIGLLPSCLSLSTGWSHEPGPRKNSCRDWQSQLFTECPLS